MSLHVFYNASMEELWVAESREDVVKVHQDETGEKTKPTDWEQYDDEESRRIHEGETEDTPYQVKTCGQWAASNGKGYLSGGRI